MKILGIDTSALYGGVAVTNNDSVVFDCFSDGSTSFSKKLLDMIDKSLKSSNIMLEEIDCFAVARGPGSFTGLRIGLATIDGLSYALDKPSVGISSLFALAESYPNVNGLLCPVLDARKSEVYASFYKREKGVFIEVGEELVIDPVKLCKMVTESVTFVGRDVVKFKKIFEENCSHPVFFEDTIQKYSPAAYVSLLGYRYFQNNKSLSFDVVTPNYIRKSDAELNWKKRG